MAERHHRLVLEAPIATPDGGGGHTTAWGEIGVLWGRIIARSGAERGLTDRPSSRVSHRIEIPREPGEARRPRADQRLRLGTRVFAIRAVTEDVTGASLILWADEGALS